MIKQFSIIPLYHYLFVTMALFIPSLAVAKSPVSAALERYNVVWTTPSKSSSESMPLSGGILGLNVWVENGDVCFLMGSPNCMDENGMQVKLGLVRFHFSPAIFEKDFRQELRLGQSEIVITGKMADGSPATVTLWCGVDKPLIHAEVSAGAPVEVKATYETWSNYEAKVVDGGLQWGRRLAEVNARRQHDMKAQGMTEFANVIPDPLSGLTAGGRITAPGMETAGAGTSKFNGMATKTYSLKTSKLVTQLDLCIALRMEQDKSAVDWEANLARDAQAAAQNAKADRAAALAWWNDFWNRSYIAINPGAPDTDNAWLAGRNYQLARYQLAANRNGRTMTLFNGGIFPCEGNPDTRMWDGCQFMAQNQRPMAWAELKTGDYDLLKVSLDFYRDRTEMNRLHAKKFWGVDGVVYNEPFSIFGLDSIGTTADGRSSPDHLHYHYASGMEFALIMLELGRYTGQDISGYLAPAQGIIHYYDQFYQKEHAKRTGKPLDENGQLVIYPSDALEIFHGCTNGIADICGLQALSQGLIDLPQRYLTSEQRAYYKAFQKRIPPITIGEVQGRKVIAPAKSYEWVFYNGNMEFPNMYVCFPFNHFFLGRNDNGIELASSTWDVGAVRPNVQRQAQCWYQSAINLARMGRTDDAKRYTLQKLVKNPSLRFPSFWTNYGFCHAPDTDHSATAMIGLQEMIMQCDGRRILLGPAWPGEWNGAFKLHAPYQTTVEGHVADGKVVVDQVSPESRRKDIEIFPLKVPPPPPVSEGKPATASTTYGAGYTPDKAFDGDVNTRWSATSGQASAWLEVDLGRLVAIGRAVIDESSYPQATKFVIEAQMDDGSWKTVAEGGTIGTQKEVVFSAIKAQKVRLRVLESKLINAQSGVTINEFQLFEK
jgi:hypothetical protein